MFRDQTGKFCMYSVYFHITMGCQANVVVSLEKQTKVASFQVNTLLGA